MLYVGEGPEREQCHLLLSLPAFTHFPHYPHSDWALLVLIPRWVGLCTFQHPVGLSSKLSCDAGSFFCCPLTLHRCFQSELLRLYVPALEPWVVQSVSLPSCSSQFICTRMWDCPGCKPLPRCESFPPGCPAPPLLLVWMNVSSLFPWLSDFHAVGFSVSSGCSFVFKFVVVLLLVVQGGTVCLPTPPTGLEVCSFIF